MCSGPPPESSPGAQPHPTRVAVFGSSLPQAGAGFNALRMTGR